MSTFSNMIWDTQFLLKDYNAGTRSAPVNGRRWSIAVVTEMLARANEKVVEKIGLVRSVSTITVITGQASINGYTHVHSGFRRFNAIYRPDGNIMEDLPRAEMDIRYGPWQAVTGYPWLYIKDYGPANEVRLYMIPDDQYTMQINFDYVPTDASSLPIAMHRFPPYFAAARILESSQAVEDRAQAREYDAMFLTEVDSFMRDQQEQAQYNISVPYIDF